MTLNISAPVADAELKPRILVIGVGGAGGNAVNNMIRSNLEGVEFIVCNTDAQALKHSQADRKIQLGASITQGLGAGARPDVGRAAAEETLEEVLEQIEGANMLFVTAGMGGGTGTGAAPVLARAARERGILTVGVVTKPFQFEGSQRMKLADAGIEELQQYVDTLIIIPNQNLFRVANEKTTFADAFKMADDVLYSGVRGVTDLMIMPGLINLDFADIRTVMSEMGKAMMGTGEADGDNRAILAAEAAISNPLLEDVTMRGARGVLINITGGADMTLFEVDEAANRIREEVDPEANIIFGSTFDESLEGIMRVSVVATGIEADMASAHRPMPLGLTRAQARLQEKRVEEPAVAATVEHPTVPVADSAAMADEEDTGAAAASLFEGMGSEAVAHHSDAPAAVAEHAEEDIFEAVDPASDQEEDHSLGGIPGFLTENAIEDSAHDGKGMEASAPVRTPDVVPPRDAFIPPRPVKPEDIAEGGQALQAAETASGDHASTVSSARQSDGENRPKRTLFERMTKLGFGSSEPKAEAAPKQPTLRAPEQASAPASPAPQHRPATGAAAAAVKVEDSQPMLGSAEPAEQPAQQAEDELLEIPAFLRRQVN